MYNQSALNQQQLQIVSDSPVVAVRHIVKIIIIFMIFG